MSGSPEDPLLRSLGELQDPPMDAARADLLRRRVRNALAAEQRLAKRPWLVPIAHAWSRAVMPTLVAGSVGVYLIWAIEFAGSLYR
jgi:hypothetical protein